MELSFDSFDSPVLTKAEIALGLCEQVGLSKREAKDVVETVYHLMLERLVSGDDVKVSGFGNFNLREKAARPGRNPRTGEFRLIEPRRVVTFHASNKLKAMIEGKSGADLADD